MRYTPEQVFKMRINDFVKLWEAYNFIHNPKGGKKTVYQHEIDSINKLKKRYRNASK